jgi:glutamyl-tRNA synthetase
LAGGGYPGTCRDPERRERKRRANPERRPAYRFRANGQTVAADDLLCGPITRVLLAGADDFVVWRADSTPAYQLAVVVDDALMRIGQVVRGVDLLGSTPWQLALYGAFGYPIPTFAHVPLLRDATGQRMAKRSSAEGLAPLRAEGRSSLFRFSGPPNRALSSAQIVGMLAASCGLAPPYTACSPQDLLPGFYPERIADHTSAEPQTEPSALY